MKKDIKFLYFFALALFICSACCCFMCVKNYRLHQQNAELQLKTANTLKKIIQTSNRKDSILFYKIEDHVSSLTNQNS